MADACRRYGIEGWENIDKEEIAKAIGEGRWREYGAAAVYAVLRRRHKQIGDLLRAQLVGYGPYAPVDPQAVMRWTEYSAKTVALIQAKGMPIDMPRWNLVQENQAAVIAALIARFDPSQGSANPIYTPEGEWGYEGFAYWLAAAGISEWPRLASGMLDIEGDTFRLMYPAHPAIEGLYALRDVLGVIVRARIPIGQDGRNRPSLFPFAHRDRPKCASQELVQYARRLRSFMKFPPDKIGLYLDWRTQEVGVAAARSGDEALREDYLVGRHLSCTGAACAG